MYKELKIPDHCLVCGEKLIGGGKTYGLYKCGCSVSVEKSQYNSNCFHLLVKNCWCQENIEASKTEEGFYEKVG